MVSAETTATWQQTVVALDRGDFTLLDELLRSKNVSLIELLAANGEPADEMNEAFAFACMVGRANEAEALLDKGVDPYAGMKTWLAGPHWAASSGQLDIIKMLIVKKIPLEIENKYGGTVLGQALWSAVNEHSASHAEIIECLIMAGAEVEPGTLEWWEEQKVPVAETKRKVCEILRQHSKLRCQIDALQNEVGNAESSGSKKLLADSLRSLGNLLRRPPFLRDAANEAYHRAAALYRELDMPLEAAWILRHIGINHEYAELLTEAERYYDESLALFRQHANDDDNNYANTVRYPAVIKNRVGKRAESKALWEEAVRRYDAMNQPLGVAEGAAWLTIFAIENEDLARAREWFAKAERAATTLNDGDTDKWIAEVRTRLSGAETARRD